MRWHHPERGWISPAQFIPIAEETSIIADIGEWAMIQACKDAVEWRGTLRVAVNVSAVQFASEEFPKIVQRALEQTGLDPSRLELEITESIFLSDPYATNRTFKALKKLGIRLALDDFGTGYSSLGYLRDAPFDKLKIDQSFVRGSTVEGNNNFAIITAVVSLAKALGMETVAEGVESLDELELITDRGADLVQGFVFSKAMPQEQVRERLETRELEFDAVGPAKHRADRRSVFRRIGVIHEDHRYDATLRNLSQTGAMIEGILNVPEGTDLVIDLGEGQLAVAKVRRSDEAIQGVEFETPLVSDGADGLCTRHRVSPYALAAAGMPLSALPSGSYPLVNNVRADGTPTQPLFMQVEVSKRPSR
jgi:EAL domain-containing protein (putative c-di-GMP-specific phosphodiesterase class I)